MKYAVLIPAMRYDERLAASVRTLARKGVPVALALREDASEQEREQWRENGAAYVYSLTANRRSAELNGALSALASDLPDVQTVVLAGQGTVFDTADIEGIAQEACRTDMPTAGIRFGGETSRRGGVTDKLSSLLFRIACGVSLPDVRSGLIAVPASMLPALLQTPLPQKNLASAVYLHFAEAKIGLAVYDMQSAGEAATAESPLHRAAGLIGSFWFLYLHSSGLKFLTSSVIAFLVDYTLTLVLANGFHWTAEVAFVCAWVVSSMCNFTLNYLFAFRSHKSFWVAFGEYYLLAAGVFAVKRMVFQELLYRVCRVPLALASPISEVLMYPVTYLVQKTVVFRKHKEK